MWDGVGSTSGSAKGSGKQSIEADANEKESPHHVMTAADEREKGITRVWSGEEKTEEKRERKRGKETEMEHLSSTNCNGPAFRASLTNISPSVKDTSGMIKSTLGKKQNMTKV